MIASSERDFVLHSDGSERASSHHVEDEGHKLAPSGPDANVGTIPWKHYCDACKASCHLMNSQRRKLQARYEGFLLVKRIQGDSSASRYYVTRETHLEGSCSRPNGTPPGTFGLIDYEKRHSRANDIDNTELEPVQTVSAVDPLRTKALAGLLPYAGNNDCLLEKLVNLYPEQGCVNNRSCSNAGVPVIVCGYRKSRKPAGSSNKHERLSRKKSKSQDNLVGKLVKLSREGSAAGDLTEQVVLNNQLSPTSTQLHSSLSRSEGSIHNVTHRTSLSPFPEGVGAWGKKADAEEFTRTPKRLLDRVTDEVGQIAFYLERWREEYVILNKKAITIKLSNGREETLLPYSQIEDTRAIAACSITGHQHCLVVVTRKASLLMEASTSYVRDQWLHTIIWKRNAYKYRNLLETAKRPEVLLKELKSLVDLSLSTPLHDHSVCEIPLELASSILTTNEGWLNRETNEEIIVILAPLLENNKPSPEICSFFSRHCSDNPRSSLVIDMFTPVVTRILKHNVNFGKYPHVLSFVQNYIQALNSQNDGQRVVHKFVQDMHGSASNCPHLRVLHNFVSVCVPAICSLMKAKRDSKSVNTTLEEDNIPKKLDCYFSILKLICDYDDWRLGLAVLFQPMPFPDKVLADEEFMRKMLSIVRRIGTDPRCEVHQTVLGPRDNNDGWFNYLCPSSLACCDNGETWTEMLQVLLSCCYKRKKFLEMLLKSLGSCVLLAVRDNSPAQEVLCLMLEWKLVEGRDQCLQIITALQSTYSGKAKYQELCDRQMHLQELQQKCGPKKLALPQRSTDSDLMKLLSSGPFGNLEILSLAFTRVTSACAEHLIKLPTLRSLNLWATQFGDNGLLQICEHLHQLEMLNLCETPVTDKGMCSIAALKKLRKLNLNSTKLSLEMFEILKSNLPMLQEVDIRYTDAW